MLLSNTSSNNCLISTLVTEEMSDTNLPQRLLYKKEQKYSKVMATNSIQNSQRSSIFNFLNFFYSLLFHLFTRKNISRLYNHSYGLECCCKSVGRDHRVRFSSSSWPGSVLAVLGAVDGWLHARVGKAVQGGGSLPACSPVSMESTSITSDRKHSCNYSNNRLYTSTRAS